MSDEAHKEANADTTEAVGSGLTRVKPGEDSPETGQGGTGSTQNALSSEPDSAREKVEGSHGEK